MRHEHGGRLRRLYGSRRPEDARDPVSQCHFVAQGYQQIRCYRPQDFRKGPHHRRHGRQPHRHGLQGDQSKAFESPAGDHERIGSLVGKPQPLVGNRSFENEAVPSTSRSRQRLQRSSLRPIAHDAKLTPALR